MAAQKQTRWRHKNNKTFLPKKKGNFSLEKDQIQRQIPPNIFLQAGKYILSIENSVKYKIISSEKFTLHMAILSNIFL